MATISFVTYSEHPEILPDDMLFSTALMRRGHEVHATVWDDPLVEWNNFDRVIIRSAWDYFKKSPIFFSWLDRLEQRNIPIWNSIPLMRWNADKTYLYELERHNIPVVPTCYIEQSHPTSLTAILQRTGWESYIIKPTISGGAYYTIKGRAGQAAEQEDYLREILQFSDVMIQPLIPSIYDPGEYSFIFFCSPEGVELSHTVIKTPKPGDFRIQENLGGQTVLVEPDRDLKAQAQHIIEQVWRIKRFDWLYARLDAVLHAGSLHLMELEMLEPSLFFMHYPSAAERLADIVVQRMMKCV